MSPTPARAGSLLIVVAGLSAIMASLAMVFLVNMKSDSEETDIVVHSAQSRIMLVAACNWIQEASRLGWEDADGREAFGWVDVRDGFMGPRTKEYTTAEVAGFLAGDPAARATVASANFPIGTVYRAPMYVMKRPPFAVQLRAGTNPMQAADPAAADFGIPLLRNPDPRPVAATWADYAAGDPAPREDSLGLSWFRVYRDGPATFIVTCGSGASLGFRDWASMSATEKAVFYNVQSVFEQAVAQEYRLWYRVEWSPAVQDGAFHVPVQISWKYESYIRNPVDLSHWGQPWAWGQANQRNMVGTIKWVQRLRDAPANW